jgi:hypothetical protein
MHIYRDTAALKAAVTSETDTQLQGLIAQRLLDLADYEESLSELIHILVIQPSDALTHVDAELGFSLADRPWDVIESHSGWYEITIVVSDDGFGWVIYIPKADSTHADLLALCTSHLQEHMP